MISTITTRQRSSIGGRVIAKHPEYLNLWEQGWSDLGDTFEEMKIRAKDKNFKFLTSTMEMIKKCIFYGPMATAHAFVFDNNRKLCYVGILMNLWKRVKQDFTEDAIDAMRERKNDRKPVTKVFGCSTKWLWKTEGTKKLYNEWSFLPVTIQKIDLPEKKSSSETNLTN